MHSPQGQTRPSSPRWTSNSLVSFDFGFASRLDGDPDPLTVLAIHDRSTKSMHAVPTPSKGGKDLPYLTGELCRFVTWIGHTSVAFRCDNEPSTIALLESAKKALKGLGAQVRAETIAPGNKQTGQWCSRSDSSGFAESSQFAGAAA